MLRDERADHRDRLRRDDGEQCCSQFGSEEARDYMKKRCKDLGIHGHGQVRVLLVEDNPGDARLVREMLGEMRTAGYGLQWAQSLAQGRQLLAEELEGDDEPPEEPASASGASGLRQEEA